MEQLITLTEKASEKSRLMTSSHNKKYLKVGLKRGGCSGYMYEFSLEDDAKEGDIVIEDKNIIISKDAVDFLKGSTLDYQESLQDAGFKIINPNVKRTCGCGISIG